MSIANRSIRTFLRGTCQLRRLFRLRGVAAGVLGPVLRPARLPCCLPYNRHREVHPAGTWPGPPGRRTVRSGVNDDRLVLRGQELVTITGSDDDPAESLVDQPPLWRTWPPQVGDLPPHQVLLDRRKETAAMTARNLIG